jgi:hypothetical protein
VTSAEFWAYDGKLGRRWNVDPVFVAGISSYMVLNGSPISSTDYKGDVVNFLAAGIGATIGFVGGFVGSIIKEGKITNKAWKHGLSGAAAGGLAGLTMGGSLAMSAAVGGLAYSGQSIVDDVIDGRKVNFNKAIINGLAGGIGTSLGSLLTRYIGNSAASAITFSSNRIINFMVGNSIKSSWTGMGAFIRTVSNKLFNSENRTSRPKKKRIPKVEVGSVTKIGEF